MKVRVDTKIDMKPITEILDKRGLSAGGKVQQHITTNLINMFDGYVPLRTGTLKGSAIRNNAPPYNEIVYDGPYAARLHYNPQYNFSEAPKRGGYWPARAWADNKDTFLYNLQQSIDKAGL